MKTTLGLLAWGLALAAMLGTGCARRAPAVAPAVPALEVPVVPERVIAPLPEPPEDPVPAEPEPRPAPRPARPRPRPTPPPEATKDPQKPETPPVEPAAEPARQEPQNVLRTPQTADDSEAARRVREALGRATSQLGRVNVQALNADARGQYETARRFIDQAEGALRARNYMFASYLADKADTLARGLVGR